MQNSYIQREMQKNAKKSMVFLMPKARGNIQVISQIQKRTFAAVPRQAAQKQA